MALAVLCFLAGSGVRAQPAAQDGGMVKVLLPAGDEAAHRALQEQGAQLIADYGPFSLWIAQDHALRNTQYAARNTQYTVQNTPSPWTIHPEFDQLVLREGTIDTQVLPPAGADAAGAGYQLSLVQFAGPVRDEWLAELRATGARTVAYLPYNGYVIWAGEEARAEIARLAAAGGALQWYGPYLPAYRLAGTLRGAVDAGQVAEVTVQIVLHPAVKESVAQIVAQSEAVLRAPYRSLEFVQLTVRLPAAALPDLAARADVFNVEPWHAPRLLDERQGQILAGNLDGSATQPSGPGYLVWLDGLGFSHAPADYPIVDVIDDGLDNGSATQPGHADFYRLGTFGMSSRVAYARDLTADGTARGVGGHGTLNASIIGGYNDNQWSGYEDAAGYQYGLGISPYGRVASSKVFNDQGAWFYWGSTSDLLSSAYQRGARISNDSWGSDQNVYDTLAQEFDVLTRDADPGTPGNQQMTHVVSAGNAGSTPGVVSPATAKNVITVGASENVRQTGTDGCGFGNADADNAQDIPAFSSRGPASDGRSKPDVVAPGTHVQGAASQIAAYDGNGVCNLYWPANQTLYTWSSGTSHAAPAAAGALSLIHSYLAKGMWGGAAFTPSPAMLKAYLVNAARYLSSASAGGDLPANGQGWGRVDLGRAFDGVPRLLVDQSVVFTGTGDAYEQVGLISNSARPLRVTLAWTDAPGATTGGAWCNDLDLSVTAGGKTYRGNVFSGANSVTGGTSDARNNLEGVRLPAGTSGTFTVRVAAANIACDGVPGSGDSTDQDFALVIYNGQVQPDFRLGVSPAAAELCAGSAVTYSVHVTRVYGYAQTVALQAGALPPEIGVSLVPNSGVPDFDAAMRVTAGAVAAAGQYTLTVTGSGAGVDPRTVQIGLSVDRASPTGTLTLMLPIDGITQADLRPTFTWKGVANARSYRLQVAGDPGFTWLLLDQAVAGLSYQPASDLLKDTHSYWRVTARNGCGTLTSETRTLTTENRALLFADDVESDGRLWTISTTAGEARWARHDDRAHSGLYAWHMPDDDQITDARLTMARGVPVDGTSVLRFWQWRDMEYADSIAWDGGVLEVSLDGGAWQDLGPHIVRGGYGHTVWTGYGNPLAGRRAWSGDSGGWELVEVNLGAFAGSTLRVRLRWGGDSSNLDVYQGWFVDDVRLTSVWPPSTDWAYMGLILR